jgi:DNA-binding MarR family transcriptional regulator
MKKNNLIILTVASVVIVILILAVVYFVRKSKEKDAEMIEMVEQMNFEKQQVEKEYSDLALEFDGYTSNIHNDSLVQLLQNEKTKVKQLLDELRITKSTNARRISQLKAELATVRQVMIQYVNQIDSLNTQNRVLKTENVEVHKKYQVATQTVEQLSKEKETLNEVVTRASMLEVTNFSMVPLNSKNKKTSWFSQTANLQFNYTIGKNITAQTGEKTIYLRITRPDDDVLTKSPNNVFPFENKNIAYSASKKIEYTGEAFSDALYWKVGEILPKGTYRADFFADGNRIGTFTFVFEK